MIFMDVNTKTTAPKPAAFPTMDAPQAVRDMAEMGVTQSRDAYEKMSATANQTAGLIKSSYSTAIKGVQDYNNKVMEFAHANTNGAFDFAQKLTTVKSPSEFVQMSTEYARKQIETLTEQSKQLVALAQQVTVATTEPIKTGVAKAFNQAA
jgi:phasin